MMSLKVSENKRYLVTENNKPFFWLGDTAWELFHRLNREESELYLRNRVAKKYNVIQAVALAELDGLHAANPYGDLPLNNDNPEYPNDAYFKHVDYIIDLAASFGLYIGFLPTWGDKINKEHWGIGPEVFNPHNAYAFGYWLGKRYADRKNIVWIMGGDRNPRDENEKEIWRRLAAGVTEGIGSNENPLITFHPQPNGVSDGGSSKYFHSESWLSFNMLQTGHCRENNVWDRIQVAYNLSPVKPVIDGEPIYEDHPVCFNAADLGTSSAYDVRLSAWLDVFSGAFGHTYGCHNIWQMYSPKHKPINGPHLAWHESLNLPGAGQMQYLRNLMKSRPMVERVPDQSLINNARGGSDRVQATRGLHYIMVYSAQGKEFIVDTSAIDGDVLQCHWYDPRTGESTESGRVKGKSKLRFLPPSSGYGQDWVLVIDDASKGYQMPRP